MTFMGLFLFLVYIFIIFSCVMSILVLYYIYKNIYFLKVFLGSFCQIFMRFNLAGIVWLFKSDKE